MLHGAVMPPAYGAFGQIVKPGLLGALACSSARSDAKSGLKVEITSPPGINLPCLICGADWSLVRDCGARAAVGTAYLHGLLIHFVVQDGGYQYETEPLCTVHLQFAKRPSLVSLQGSGSGPEWEHAVYWPVHGRKREASSTVSR